MDVVISKTNLLKEVKSNGRWDLRLCKLSASKFTTRTKWQHGCNAAYQAAYKNGWMDGCCGHMPALAKKWSIFECKRSARKHTSRTEWQSYDPRAYQAAHRYGWIPKCCTHMKTAREARNHVGVADQDSLIHWTFDECVDVALTFKTRLEWKRNGDGTYNTAHKRDWLDECCRHMMGVRSGHSLESCKKIAAQYSTRVEWQFKSNDSFLSAFRNLWLGACCTHMYEVRY